MTFASLTAAVLFVGAPTGERLRADDLANIRPEEPFVVVSLRGVDRTLAIVDDLLAAGDVAQFSAVVRGFVGGLNDLRGIDRTRRLGGLLFVSADDPHAPPAPLIVLPITDLSQLETTLAATGNQLEATAAPGVYRLRLGRDQLVLTLAGTFACIADPKNVAPIPTEPQLTAWLTEAAGDPDVSLRVRRLGLPDAWTQDGLDKLQANFDRERDRAVGNEAEQQLREILLRELQAGLVSLLTDFASATVALQIPSGAGPLRIDVDLEASPEGASARGLDSVLVVPDRFAEVRSGAAALSWRQAAVLPPTVRALAVNLAAHARAEVNRGLDAKVPEDLRQHVQSLFDALAATLEAGRLEGLLQFVPAGDGKFVLLAAVGVEQEAAVNTAVRGLLPYARQSGEVETAAVDAFTEQGLSFHLLRGRHIRARDARLYGDDAALHLAVGKGGVWLAVGGRPTAAVVAGQVALERPAERLTTSARLELRLRPWLELAAGLEGEARRKLLQAALAELDEPDSDLAVVELYSTGRGCHVQATLQRGYLHLLARGVVESVRARRTER